MRFYIIVLFLISSVYAQGLLCQVPGSWVIASAGDVGTTSDLHISWTLGEIAIDRFSTHDLYITEGFHQPFSKVFPLQPEVSVLRFIPDIRVYPNPVTSLLTIDLPSESTTTIFLTVLQIDGTPVNHLQIPPGIRSIDLDLTDQSSGIYMLQFRHHTGERFAVYRIVKLQ